MRLRQVYDLPRMQRLSKRARHQLCVYRAAHSSTHDPSGKDLDAESNRHKGLIDSLAPIDMEKIVKPVPTATAGCRSFGVHETGGISGHRKAAAIAEAASVDLVIRYLRT
jgi:hypothetical protein